MTDRSPLQGFMFPDYGDRLRIEEWPYLAQVNVRARSDDVAAAATAFGVPLPPTVGAVGGDGPATTLCLGPDEWLVVGAAMPETVPPGVGVVDVSAQRTAIVLSGPSTLEVLAFGCALDLESMPGRWCAQTEVARTGVIMWGSGDRLHLLVRASYARHLATWLVDAATSALGGG